MKFDGIDLLDWLHRYWRQDTARLKWLCWWRGHVWSPQANDPEPPKR